MQKFQTEGAVGLSVVVSRPCKFLVYRNGQPYYLRDLRAGNTVHEFNAMHPGNYEIKAPVRSVVQSQPRMKELIVTLPERERNFAINTNARIKFNPELQYTPARIFKEKGIIEVSPVMTKIPFLSGVFITLHEFGHYLYSTEWKCDLFALYHFISAGFPESQAFYAIDKVLSKSGHGNYRRAALYNFIKRNTKWKDRQTQEQQ